MAVKCPECKSTEVQNGIAGNQCLTCGSLFDESGAKREPGPTPEARRVLEAQLAPRRTVVVGNFAALQVGEVGNIEPTTPTPSPPISPAEDDARKGLITRETERTGAADKIRKAQERGDQVTTTESTKASKR